MHELMRIAMVAAGLLPVIWVASLIGCDACTSVVRHHRHTVAAPTRTGSPDRHELGVRRSTRLAPVAESEAEHVSESASGVADRTPLVIRRAMELQSQAAEDTGVA